MADSFQDAKELKMTLDEEKKDLLNKKNGILREKAIKIIKL